MPTAKVSTPRIGVLNCLIERDEETKLYISHCLNYDLMESGVTADQAWRNLKMAVKQYIEYCHFYNSEGFLKSASAEEWARFAEVLRTCGTVSRVEEIEIDLHTPSLGQEFPVWMQGVDTDGADCSNVQ